MTLLEGRTINEVLKERRKDRRGMSNFPTIAEMGTALKEKFGQDGRTGSWINLVELGHADIMRLKDEVRLELLRLYGFSVSDIEYLNERFNLQLPLSVKNNTLIPFTEIAAQGLVSVKVLSDSNQGTVTLLKDAVKGRDEDKCFVISATAGVLACQKVKDKYGANAVFVFAQGEEPVEGKTVAYRMKDTGCLMLCLYEETPPVFAAIDYGNYSNAVMIYPNDERLEYLGVMLTAQVEG